MDDRHGPACPVRDYPSLLPRLLDRLFADPGARAHAEQILSGYGRESYQLEIPRVRVGILRLSGPDLDALSRWTDLACADFRDLLVAAEYPLTFRHQRLRESDPARYARLGQRERREYDEWLAAVLDGEEPSPR